MTGEPTLADHLASLWDHLGLRTAHVAAQIPADLSGFVSQYPERIASLLLCEAPGIDPAPLAALATRMALVAGDAGLSGKAADAAAPQLPGCRRVALAGYGEPLWADSVSHRTGEIVAALRDLPGEASVPTAAADRGSHAGITYRIHGAGPALVLLPLLLAPSQWDAAIPHLAQHYSVVVLGGRHLSGVALLEDRAASPSYAGMVRTMLDVIASAAGETLLEVGCGSGALLRLVARHLGRANPLTGVDLNPFLLREAAVLAEEDGVAGRISFREGNAERLPFEDGSFGHAYSVTVLEECDADLALRELRRVVRPGGRVGVIVRAADMPHAWNVELPEALRLKVENRPPLVGPRGVADRSLYARMGAAGFEQLTCFPMLASFDRVDGSFFRFGEGRVLAQLSAEEKPVWQAARQAALDAGVLFMTGPHHCVVGRKP
ncbi:methyltransferase domain-containing protein [Dankookia rubra]|uniref:Methyltransferase domain-containing protein n=1 Tax=Dankookia rubra TaxID=1442381 RepID=A0A4R5Q7Q8_9PROT|nr:methyltransferase domain-containing protein [Dankookia rubra]TDH58311.1 methyltransferase domain-containing protein [Dankookia rubra]